MQLWHNQSSFKHGQASHHGDLSRAILHAAAAHPVDNLALWAAGPAWALESSWPAGAIRRNINFRFADANHYGGPAAAVRLGRAETLQFLR
jgi:hypothetical protein